MLKMAEFGQDNNILYLNGVENGNRCIFIM